MHRFRMEYPPIGSKPLWRYVVRDSESNAIVFGSESKSEAIAKSQTLNGFDPIDGSEQTYGEQIRRSI